MDILQCRFQTFMAKEFLDLKDACARLKAMGGKGMAQGMDACVNFDAGFFLGVVPGMLRGTD